MPEMNGATLTLKDPTTGQVVEYEIVRAGTMREFRGLVKAHELRGAELVEVRDACDALKQHADNADLRLADMAKERDELALKATQHEHAAKAAEACIVDLSKKCEDAEARLAEMTRQKNTAADTIATLQDTLEKVSTEKEDAKERRAALAGKIEEHKSALAEIFPDLLGAIDELHEG